MLGAEEPEAEKSEEEPAAEETEAEEPQAEETEPATEECHKVDSDTSFHCSYCRELYSYQHEETWIQCLRHACTGAMKAAPLLSPTTSNFNVITVVNYQFLLRKITNYSFNSFSRYCSVVKYQTNNSDSSTTISIAFMSNLSNYLGMSGSRLNATFAQGVGVRMAFSLSVLAYFAKYFITYL